MSAGRIEALVEVLDLLWIDLVNMDKSTAISLESWPAAQEFVEQWRRTHPQ